jgi:hypothetical protein
MLKITWFSAVATAILVLAAHSAFAVPVVLTDDYDQLVGARNVDVGGTLYDVDFRDGYCLTYYPGCDSTDDFTFQTQAAADAASQALLDTVFINGDPAFAELQYQTFFAEVTYGCRTGGFSISVPPGQCSIVTPYQFRLVGTHPIVDFSTLTNGTSPLHVSGSSADVDVIPDLGSFSNRNVLAVWRLAPTTGDGGAGGGEGGGGGTDPVSVPEPSSLMLLTAGVMGLLLSRQKLRGRS